MFNIDLHPIGTYSNDDLTVWPFKHKDAAVKCVAGLRADPYRQPGETYQVVERVISALGVRIPMWCVVIRPSA